MNTLHMIMITHCTLYITQPLGMGVTQWNNMSYKRIKISQAFLIYEESHWNTQQFYELPEEII